jgi:hypothetical protein
MCKLNAVNSSDAKSALVILKSQFINTRDAFDLPFDWDRVLAGASDPTSARSVEKSMERLINRELESRRASRGPAAAPDEVHKSVPASFEGLDAAATAALPLAHHSVSVSFQTQGAIDRHSGKVMFMVVVAADDFICGMQMVHGDPTARDLEWALHVAMHHPEASSGCKPSRPTAVLVAHRWGRAIFNAVEPRLLRAGVPFVIFESAADARATALAHGNDPNGRNFDLPADGPP